MAKRKDLQTLIDLTTSTQRLFTHYQASLAPSNVTTPATQTAENGLPNPLEAVKASATLLKSHTTTLSLLLITPPLTPSAVIAKLKEISSGPLSGMVAAASYTYQDGQIDTLGRIMRVEVKSQVRRLISPWADILVLISDMAERRQATKKDDGLSESEKQQVLSATGMVWEACDTLLKLCTDGIVGLIVKKAGELRAVLLDAIEELKEWGDDIDDGSDDEATHSDDEDDMFGSSNKLGKDDKELRNLLDASLKKLKMIGMLYQALIKRRLKTYSPAPPPATNGAKDATMSPSIKLDKLMDRMKTIPETVDDLASAFYDLDQEEVKQTLDKCCTAAKDAVDIVKQSWNGTDDEFTAWSFKWLDALEAA